MIQSNIIEQLTESLSFEMILVEGGHFKMGSEEGESKSWEKPIHKVQISDFYIGKHPVTQELWEAVIGNNPSFFVGYNRPIERVSWNDTREFIKRLNKKTSRKYRLLTESEWEYAARGGKKSRGYKYTGGNKLKDVGWHNKNSHGETKPVGLKYPNELGLYDMSGNVYEWVEDQWHNDYNNAPDNGKAWTDLKKGANRVKRGGSWIAPALYCRCFYRYVSDPSDCVNDLGFRLGLSL